MGSEGGFGGSVGAESSAELVEESVSSLSMAFGAWVWALGRGSSGIVFSWKSAFLTSILLRFRSKALVLTACCMFFPRSKSSYFPLLGLSLGEFSSALTFFWPLPGTLLSLRPKPFKFLAFPTPASGVLEFGYRSGLDWSENPLEGSAFAPVPTAVGMLLLLLYKTLPVFPRPIPVGWLVICIACCPPLPFPACPGNGIGKNSLFTDKCDLKWESI